MTKTPQATLLDAWLDFAALKIAAAASEDNPAPTPDDPAQWRYVEKPAPGFLVPLMTGYQRLSELYPAGKVANARDDKTPFAWVEAAYGIGEWCGLHRIKTLTDLFWRYRISGVSAGQQQQQKPPALSGQRRGGHSFTKNR